MTVVLLSGVMRVKPETIFRTIESVVSQVVPYTLHVPFLILATISLIPCTKTALSTGSVNQGLIRGRAVIAASIPIRPRDVIPVDLSEHISTRSTHSATCLQIDRNRENLTVLCLGKSFEITAPSQHHHAPGIIWVCSSHRSCARSDSSLHLDPQHKCG